MLVGCFSSVIWIAYERTRIPGESSDINSLIMGIVWVLISSVIAGFKLPQRKEDTTSRLWTGVALTISFIFLNALIVVLYCLWSIDETADQ